MNKIILRTEQHRQRAIDIISAVKLEPVIEVVVQPHKDKKTLAQLKTVHMWLNEVQKFFAESQGAFYTTDALKEYFKGLFGVVEVLETPSGNKERQKSFADYQIDEMQAFMDQMNHYCTAELGCFLTLPGFDE